MASRPRQSPGLPFRGMLSLADAGSQRATPGDWGVPVPMLLAGGPRVA